MTTTTTNSSEPENGYLDGQLLVAMPVMRDPRFARSVIYMCAHSNEGAMGLILNKPTKDLSFSDLLQRLEIGDDDKPAPQTCNNTKNITVHSGGPVETGRGFVLHSADYFATDTTLSINGDICLTATIEILKAMATGDGPDQVLLALGYAGWSPGQLENEIHGNGWLHCPATPELVFSNDNDGMYNSALAQIGVNPAQLVSDVGHA